jgi:tetratricopeptide (TPR) repeat protein
LDGSDGSNCGDDVQALRDASAARNRGDTAAAAAAVANAVAIHEADRRHYAELDVPYRETGFDRMLAELKAGIELKARLPTWQAYQERGNARSKAGNYLGAADDFGMAIRIGPVNTALHYLRGVALLHAGNPVGAAAEFERGLKLEPSNPTLAQLLQQARGAERPN